MEHLREIRTGRFGLSTTELGALLGLDHSTISRYEKSVRRHSCTRALYESISLDIPFAIQGFLRGWWRKKPLSKNHIDVLIILAKRFFNHFEYQLWEDKIKQKHPEFFDQEESP